MTTVLVAALLLTTCGPGKPNDTARGEASADAARSFEVVVDEAHCGLQEPLRQVIRNRQEWARLWQRIYRPVEPAPELPEVDFSRQMLIVVAAGTRRSGGFDLTVERIEAGDHLEVTVREFCPAAGAIASMSLTQPVEVVRLPRSERRVVFREVKDPSCP